MTLGILGHNYAIRTLADKPEYHFTSITTGGCTRDTYIYLLRKRGLDKYIRFRLLIWLIRKVDRS